MLRVAGSRCLSLLTDAITASINTVNAMRQTMEERSEGSKTGGRQEPPIVL